MCVDCSQSVQQLCVREYAFCGLHCVYGHTRHEKKKNSNKKTYKAITLSTASKRSVASEYVAFFLFRNTFGFSFSELFVAPLHFSFVYLPFKCDLKIVLFSCVVHKSAYITWVFAPFLPSLWCARGAFLIIRTMNFSSNALSRLFFLLLIASTIK